MIQGFTAEDFVAVVKNQNLKQYYYPTLFPTKETQFLTWKMVEQKTKAKVAADVISRNASIPKKLREELDYVKGDIPKISIRRDMLEEDLTDYDIALALARNNTDLANAIKYWADDIDFCWTGVASRIEWLALRSISTGKIQLTNENNASVVTEYNVDYEIPAEQKIGVINSYNNSNGKPLSEDFANALKVGRERHKVDYKYVFMNTNTFNKLAMQDEVLKGTSTLIQNLADVPNIPQPENVNAYLSKYRTKFKGLQIIVLDQDITVELADHSQITGNPFEDDVMLFSTDKNLGTTWWKSPVDLKLEPRGVADMKLHDHILIKKYAEEGTPVSEITEGIANAFPAWNLAGTSTLMQVDSTSWNKN